MTIYTFGMQDRKGANVLVFDGIIFSLQRNGGISVYFSELLKRFGSLQLESKVLMFGDNQVSQSPALHPRREDCCARPLERYRSVATSGAGLFHSSYYRCSTGGRLSNVTTVYDFTYERFVGGPRKWVHSWQKFAAIRRSDAVLCISESTKRDLHEYLPDVPEEKVIVTPLAANPAFATDTVCGAPDDYVLFVGARGGYKNFALLVKALARLSDMRLYVVGGGAFSADERRQLDEAIPGRYIHQGSVSVAQLRDLYNRALCLVYPSAYEGFGIPVLEAMSAGCPVIAQNRSSIPEVAGEAAMLLDDPDVAALSDAMTRVSQSDVRLKLIESGRQRARMYSWDATFEKTRGVYEELLGRSLR